jgi:hypothetical protein
MPTLFSWRNCSCCTVGTAGRGKTHWIWEIRKTQPNFLLTRLHATHCRERVHGGVEEIHFDLDNCLLNHEVRAYCLREGIRIVPYAPHAPDAHGMSANPHKYLWQLYRISKHSYRDSTALELPASLRRYVLQHSVQGVNS